VRNFQWANSVAISPKLMECRSVVDQRIDGRRQKTRRSFADFGSPLEMLKSQIHGSKIAKRRLVVGLDFQSCSYSSRRLIQPPLLQCDNPEKMSCVELPWPLPQYRLVHALRLAESPGLMKGSRFWEERMQAGISGRGIELLAHIYLTLM
jgi:hypothetical protein